MSLGVGVQLAQHRETSRSCLKTRTDQNRTEKKQNRTSESWDRLGSDSTGDFSGGKQWLHDGVDAARMGHGAYGAVAGTQHMPQILHCTPRIITTGK